MRIIKMIYQDRLHYIKAIYYSVQFKITQTFSLFFKKILLRSKILKEKISKEISLCLDYCNVHF